MSALEKVLYTAVATADMGREGRVSTDDGRLDVGLSKPPGMGGRDGEVGTNPEQLFAAGYAGCFHGALLFHARAAGVDAEGSDVTARVEIGRLPDEGGLGLRVELLVNVPGAEPSAVEELTAKAHESCPYSRATRGNIDVTITITTP
jgi:Ohr subfamily peroxiredoxin